MSEQNDHTFKLVSFLVGSGILGVLSAGILSIANNARTAINVAAQHGEELLLIRGEMTSIRLEMMNRTKDRFTSQDGEYLKERLERIEDEVREHLQETH